MARVTDRDEGLVQISAAGVPLEGNLILPQKATGVVLFAHGSGSSRFSSRNRYVAEELRNDESRGLRPHDDASQNGDHSRRQPSVRRAGHAGEGRQTGARMVQKISAMTRQVPQESWKSFLDSFSRQHHGWLVILDGSEPEPLEHVRSDGRTIEII